MSEACPWAHRTTITRVLKGLNDSIGVTKVSPFLAANGWEFSKDDPDPLLNAKCLHEIYSKSHLDYTGSVTTPVLFDMKN